MEQKKTNLNVLQLRNDDILNLKISWNWTVLHRYWLYTYFRAGCCVWPHMLEQLEWHTLDYMAVVLVWFDELAMMKYDRKPQLFTDPPSKANIDRKCFCKVCLLVCSVTNAPHTLLSYAVCKSAIQVGLLSWYTQLLCFQKLIFHWQSVETNVTNTVIRSSQPGNLICCEQKLSRALTWTEKLCWYLSLLVMAKIGI